MEPEETQRAHHKQSEVAHNRPSYREARWERAVKVYTVNQESKYLLVQNVHALGVTQELLQLFALYGNIEEYRLLDEYPSEPYTDVYWIKFVDLNAARIAKKKLDNHSFFGKNIHVCYAPEFESVEDTRDKLQQRRIIVATKTRDSHQKPSNRSTKVRDSPQLSSNPISKPSTTVTIPPNLRSDSPPHTMTAGYSSQDERIPPLFPHLPPPPSHIGMSYSSTHDPNGTSPSTSTAFSLLQTTTSHHKEIEKPSKLSKSEMKPSTSTSKDSNPYISSSGLSKSQRIAAFLSGSSSSVVHSPTVPESSQTKDTSCGHEKDISGQVISTSAKSTEHGMHNEKMNDHRETKNMHVHVCVQDQHVNPQCQSTRSVPQQSFSPVTGNKSLDTSIQSIREHMNKVWQVPDSSTKQPKPPKLKKRRRI